METFCGGTPPDSIRTLDVQWVQQARDDVPLVVLLHGFGGTEQDMAAIGSLAPSGWAAAALRAPHHHGTGRSWFHVPDEALDARVEHVASAADALAHWVGAHRPAGQPVIVVGFSQGGAVAIQTMRRHPRQISAVAMLSGFIPRGSGAGDAVLRELRPPLLWAHGGRDDVIPERDIDLMNAYLPAHITLTRHHYPTLGHATNSEELADLRRFLDTCA